MPRRSARVRRSSSNLERGFKVHARVVFPLTSPLVAQTVDIEIARYDGVISGANANGFIYTRKFNTAKDDYTVTFAFHFTPAPRMARTP